MFDHELEERPPAGLAVIRRAAFAAARAAEHALWDYRSDLRTKGTDLWHSLCDNHSEAAWSAKHGELGRFSLHCDLFDAAAMNLLELYQVTPRHLTGQIF